MIGARLRPEDARSHLDPDCAMELVVCQPCVYLAAGPSLYNPGKHQRRVNADDLYRFQTPFLSQVSIKASYKNAKDVENMLGVGSHVTSAWVLCCKQVAIATGLGDSRVIQVSRRG